MPLWNVADPPALVVLVGWDAEEVEFTGGAGRQPKKRPDKRRLSRAVGSNDRGELAGANGEVDITQNGGVFITERCCAQLDERWG